MFDAWHEFCDVSIVRDQLKKNLKFWDDMDNKGLTTIEVSLKYFCQKRFFFGFRPLFVIPQIENF